MNEMVLIDFGLSQQEGEEFKYEGGTAGYLAPEGFFKNNTKRTPFTCKYDMYSVGCILYSY